MKIFFLKTPINSTEIYQCKFCFDSHIKLYNDMKFIKHNSTGSGQFF